MAANKVLRKNDVMQIRSNIPTGSVCCVGVPIRFEGYADDFELGISAVEFSLDDGVHWTAYPTTGAVADKGVNWRFDYTPSGVGYHVLKARAVDGAGVPSTVATRFAFRALTSRPYGAVVAAVRSELLNSSAQATCDNLNGALYGSFRLRAVGGGPLEGAHLF